MAADLNSVNIVGRLTRDPELRHTGSGASVANLRLAFTSRVKSGDAWEDRSNYVDVVAFGSQADNASKYLGKGRRIAVNGRLSFSEWQAQDGSKRSNIEVVANDIQYIDSRPEGSSDASDLPVSAGAGDSRGPDDTDVPF